MAKEKIRAKIDHAVALKVVEKFRKCAQFFQKNARENVSNFRKVLAKVLEVDYYSNTEYRTINPDIQVRIRQTKTKALGINSTTAVNMILKYAGGAEMANNIQQLSHSTRQ